MLRSNKKLQVHSDKAQENQKSCNLKLVTYNSQNGNVFIIILVAIFLFGALMFTFSRSGSQGVSSISKQEAKIAAQEILNYARLVEGAVDRVRRNGCSESEISFENSTVAGYTNANAPVDKSCHVFDDTGGKIEYQKINEKFLWNGHSAITYYALPEIRIGHQILDVGSTREDLLLKMFHIKESVCLEINKLVGVDNPSNNMPEDDTPVNSSKFTGTFPGVLDTMGDEATEISGKHSFCRTTIGNTNPVGQFIHVILAR